eukprot:CAMPEP_0195145738 /NCGR_PEP_ID=MMETSP0448-20130528/170325_1 /TAXON_ID=66468 /ORGANISM="Heterocapsa triquestra, Strain CCMP 448" /LENGTH=426 /DNA_ID=CAMNT_0040184261 /DNA_START=1 /DNA_END=1277 /DNA_ORIENTATION=+
MRPSSAASSGVGSRVSTRYTMEYEDVPNEDDIDEEHLLERAIELTSRKRMARHRVPLYPTRRPPSQGPPIRAMVEDLYDESECSAEYRSENYVRTAVPPFLPAGGAATMQRRPRPVSAKATKHKRVADHEGTIIYEDSEALDETPSPPTRASRPLSAKAMKHKRVTDHEGTTIYEDSEPSVCGDHDLESERQQAGWPFPAYQQHSMSKPNADETHDVAPSVPVRGVRRVQAPVEPTVAAVAANDTVRTSAPARRRGGGALVTTATSARRSASVKTDAAVPTGQPQPPRAAAAAKPSTAPPATATSVTTAGKTTPSTAVAACHREAGAAARGNTAAAGARSTAAVAEANTAPPSRSLNHVLRTAAASSGVAAAGSTATGRANPAPIAEPVAAATADEAEERRQAVTRAATAPATAAPVERVSAAVPP